VLATARVRPYVTRMDVIKLMRALEAAWGHALPGRETAERDHVLRELQRLLKPRPPQLGLAEQPSVFGRRSWHPAGRGRIEDHV
jgi:hypothetical protein